MKNNFSKLENDFLIIPGEAQQPGHVPLGPALTMPDASTRDRLQCRRRADHKVKPLFNFPFHYFKLREKSRTFSLLMKLSE